MIVALIDRQATHAEDMAARSPPPRAWRPRAYRRDARDLARAGRTVQAAAVDLAATADYQVAALDRNAPAVILWVTSIRPTCWRASRDRL